MDYKRLANADYSDLSLGVGAASGARPALFLLLYGMCMHGTGAGAVCPGEC